MSEWAKRESRRIEKARTLLRPGLEGSAGQWADLGCGNGIFTSALFTLLQPDAVLYAVDRDARAIRGLCANFAESFPQARLLPLQADFTRRLPLAPLDGLIMANALHFYPDKIRVLAQLQSVLKPGAPLIVVEYNAQRGNFAVPYPLPATGFSRLAAQSGYSSAQVIRRIPSSFLGEMYAARCVAPEIDL